jgi:hypothetical protein
LNSLNEPAPILHLPAGIAKRDEVKKSALSHIAAGGLLQRFALLPGTPYFLAHPAGSASSLAPGVLYEKWRACRKLRNAATI